MKINQRKTRTKLLIMASLIAFAVTLMAAHPRYALAQQAPPEGPDATPTRRG